MDNQSLPPIPPSAFSGRGPNRAPLTLILMVVLGLGAAAFAALTVYFYGQATTATTTLSAHEKAAAQAATDSQKKIDAADAVKANESPFRSYVAPDADGSFVINFPKDWSGYVDEETSGTQVSLVLNPDFVRRANSVDSPAAVRVKLIQTPQTQYLANFSGNIKNGKIIESSTTVSGQPAFNLVGKFPDQKTLRAVVVPVRDSVIVFTNENNQYSAEFSEILAQAKIIP